jgi:hypothetical protein
VPVSNSISEVVVMCREGGGDVSKGHSAFSLLGSCQLLTNYPKKKKKKKYEMTR